MKMSNKTNIIIRATLLGIVAILMIGEFSTKIQAASSVNQQQISLKFRYAHFLSIPTSINNRAHQVKVIVNYTVAASNAPILNKTVNAIMKVYAVNGTLIKISSTGCRLVKHSGTEQLATTIKDNKIQQLTAVVQFTTADKLQTLSDPLTVKLVFGQKIGSRV
jgi:hypothetical protein